MDRAWVHRRQSSEPIALPTVRQQEGWQRQPTSWQTISLIMSLRITTSAGSACALVLSCLVAPVSKGWAILCGSCGCSNSASKYRYDATTSHTTRQTAPITVSGVLHQSWWPENRTQTYRRG